ncbi:MAG: glycosyltransferase family 39 protein [Gammaproteobacteria bacterium]|nr:glycosyltransferase family 39 protein [Gammaproteobacteria bacterium]
MTPGTKQRILPPYILCTGLWLLLVLVALATRPLWPIDETRYVSVAWEMWLRGDFLVPYLNGEPYSHKPPLLFWLFHSGWWLFGVNEWWPRLVPPLFALANLFLSAHVARLLWPQQRAIAQSVPWILLGALLWTLFTTLVFFDMLVTFFTLLGIIGILHAWHYRAARGFAILGLAIGLGILAKGPVILLHTLPLAVLAPWWMREQRPASRPRWYLGILGALLLGAAIALAWAVPAALRGGEEYSRAIFWGQTAERMVQSFAHRHPWWWYLPLLPALLFPWLLWPALWRGFRQLTITPAETGVRFCLAWMIPVLIAFSLISGKQPHYLLPVFPAFALLAARALQSSAPKRWDNMPVGAALILFGAMLMSVSALVAYYPDLPAWLYENSFLPGMISASMGMLLFFLHPASVLQRVIALTLASVLIISALTLTLIRAAAPAYDLHQISAYIGDLQRAGHPVAYIDKYHGQFQFLGRLREPLQVIGSAQVADWIQAHPSGRLVSAEDNWRPPGNPTQEFTQPYRGKTLSIWGREAFTSGTDDATPHAAPAVTPEEE